MHKGVARAQAVTDGAEKAVTRLGWFTRVWVAWTDHEGLVRHDAEIRTKQAALEKAKGDLAAAKEGRAKAEALLKDDKAAEDALRNELAEVRHKLSGLPFWQTFQAEAWSMLWRWKWTLVVFVVCFITPIGTLLRKVLVWFLPGWLVERQTIPLSFARSHRGSSSVGVSGNRVSVSVPIPHAHTGWFRDEYLDRTAKPRGWRLGHPRMLSRRFWLMSLFDGLWCLAQYKGDPRGETSVTISDPDDPAVEFAEIHIPTGESLILRPRCIVGLVFPQGRHPRIRKHWRLSHIQAWVVGHLWFFEMSGPVRLFVRGPRGVRPHRVSADESVEDRINPGSLLAFCPRLQLRVRRSESLWHYLGGSAPVFNYSFIGGSTYLTQETQAGSRRGGPLAWLAGLGDGLFKLAGF